MPSMHDTIYSTETILLEHFESTPIFYVLMIVTYFILNFYLYSEKRCAATELLLFAVSVYVETWFILQDTDYADDILYAVLLLAFLVETYTNIFSQGRDYDSKLTAVTLILIVAWVVSWLCVPRLQGHRFSAMWVSKNWHRKLGFLQDCMGTTYAYYTHTVPQHVETIFLERQFIEKWFLTMYWGAAGVVIVLWVSICVVKRDREISTEDKNKIETHEATIQKHVATNEEHGATIQKQKATIQEHKATIQKNEAIIRKQEATIQENEATIQKHEATIEEQGATMQELGETMQKQVATIEEQGATIQEHEATIQEHEATIQEHEATIQEHEATIQKNNIFMQACEKLRNDLHTALRQSRVDIDNLRERYAVLQFEAAEAGVRVPPP